MPSFLGRSLAAKLALALLAAGLAVYLLILLDVHRWTREMLVGHIRRQGDAVIEAAAARIEAQLLRVEETARRLAHSLLQGLPARAALERELCANVALSPTVFGSAAAFEPGAFDVRLPRFSPYCYREGDGLKVKDLAQGGYGYETQDWYRFPRDRGAPLWSEPYFDEGGGGILMATYSLPVREPGGRLLGIATADVALEWLQQLMSGIKVGATGYAFLLSRSGGIVTHPDPRLAMKASLAAVAAERGDPGLERLAQAVAAGGMGMERTPDLRTGAPSFVVFRPLMAAGWNLAVVFPEAETLADVDALQRRLWLTGLAGAFFLGTAVILVARRSTRPLVQLTRAAQDVASGRLDTPLPEASSRDEVGRLTASFAEMQTALTQYIEAVKESAAAEERLESELRVARQIQMSLLPRPADLSPDKLGCEVFGLLEPARAVGGDLFDVVVRRPGEISFVIGDVSDKGIPAALFMAVTDIHFEAAARELPDPAAVLARVNDALVVESTANMFVTLACGVLDTGSGRLSLANGGHTRPVLVPAAGKPRFVEGSVGTVLGVVSGVSFERHDLKLEPGDALLLYTDGVTEAHDSRSTIFGEERLIEHLASRSHSDPPTLAEGVHAAVRAFAGSAPQFDDIAILVVRRSASAGSGSALVLESRTEELVRGREWMENWCSSRGVDAETIQDLDLALDEVVANIIHHGYGSHTSGPIALRLALEGEVVRLEVSDRTPAFNPLEAGPPRSGSADGSGGLGVHIVRQVMDRVEYTRQNGENRLVLERKRARPGAGSAS
ncbi:MAG TPA: SpoIIE family protein phosphatase [Vicinamibacteria bacterium]|nr:SpoIIE family protein phosphatase [Vicinamibacteria bacterium]